MAQTDTFPTSAPDSRQVVRLVRPQAPTFSKQTSLEMAHAALLTRIAALRVPHIIGSADGDDMRDLNAHLIEVADAVDAYVAQIGAECSSNAIMPIDLSVFNRPMFGAIDHNATFVINEAADELDEANGQFGVGA